MSGSGGMILGVLSIVLVMSYGEAARIVRLKEKGKAGKGMAEVRHETGSWCMAKAGGSQTQMQQALDWACGKGSSLGNVDCSAINTGGVCYNPNTIQDHASYAFNLYYQSQNQQPFACNFNGAAQVVTTDPSTPSCTYSSSSVTVPANNDGGTTSPVAGNNNGGITSPVPGNNGGITSPIPGNNDGGTTSPMTPTSLSPSSFYNSTFGNIGGNGSIDNSGIGHPADAHCTFILLSTLVMFLFSFII